MAEPTPEELAKKAKELDINISSAAERGIINYIKEIESIRSNNKNIVNSSNNNSRQNNKRNIQNGKHNSSINRAGRSVEDRHLRKVEAAGSNPAQSIRSNRRKIVQES